jgi:predicted Zn-dependent peptidase
MYTLSTLPSGLRVLTAPVEGTSSVTVMVFAGAGSRYEIESERGISHFLEHMFFKGGIRYPTTKDVSAAIDGVGGEFNAFTGKEYAGYYVKVAADEIRLACDVLGDMLLSATFPPEEIEKERGVIMEEERMYQDTPMYRAGWDFEEVLFGDHPLGWDTIGTEKVIMSVQQADFLKHRNELYAPKNLVVTFSGKITQKEAEALAKEYFGKLSGDHERSFIPFKEFGPKRVFLRTKATEQSHLVIGVPGVSALDKDHYAMKLLAIALGGNMSSRMFLRIREAKGLCYYIATETDSYLDAGALTTRAGVDQSRLHEAIADIVREYNLCAAEGVEEEELIRAKDFLRGKLTLSLEDSEERAHFYGKQELLYPETVDLLEYMKKVDAVTVKQVNDLAKLLLKKEEYRLVVIGKEDNEADIQKLLLA